MTAMPQNPGSYEEEIEKRQTLFNPISQNDAESFQINWPDVPGGFVFLVLRLFQNVLFNKVWINLQKWKWSALERASNQLWSPRKRNIFHCRIYTSSIQTQYLNFNLYGVYEWAWASPEINEVLLKEKNEVIVFFQVLTEDRNYSEKNNKQRKYCKYCKYFFHMKQKWFYSFPERNCETHFLFLQG